jgi:hypothetical protein
MRLVFPLHARYASVGLPLATGEAPGQLTTRMRGCSIRPRKAAERLLNQRKRYISTMIVRSGTRSVGPID